MTRSIRRHYSVQGATHDVDLTLDHARLVGHLDGREVEAEARVVRAFPGGADVVVAHDGGRTRAVVLRDGDVVHVALRGRTFRLGVVAARKEADAAGAPNGADPFVASPMTGVVRQVAAAAGKSFAPGETLVVVEAMKMEFAVEAPRAVVVDEVRAKAGDRVDIGHVLVTFRAEAR